MANTMKSFIEILPESEYPLENLPFGVFSTKENPQHRIGVAIGDYVVDILQICDYLPSESAHAFKEPTLNHYIGLNHEIWTKTRNFLKDILSLKTQPDSNEIKIQDIIKKSALIMRSECIMHLPITVGDYTDFYCSKGHANNMGLLFRGKENDLPPNWLHLPVGYHGRASSIIISIDPVIRPNGQTKPDESKPPVFGPSLKLDIELEMAFIVGGCENPLGTPVHISKAQNRIFGIVIMNDWSARDIQKWEYFPLGPFLGKSFATSISPWIVTIDALKPFIVPNVEQVPEPLPYLRHSDHFNFDIHLEVWYKTTMMTKPQLISSPNLSKHLYWNLKQMLTHHSSNGCNLKPGDLMGTGTISGENPNEFGSLVELSWNGKKPITMTETGEQRTFLQDGDEITLKGYCQSADGKKVLGFGECIGKIYPAPKY